MIVTQSPITQVGETFEREIAYQVGLKVRREIFVGWSRDQVNEMVAERLAELRQQS